MSSDTQTIRAARTTSGVSAAVAIILGALVAVGLGVFGNYMSRNSFP